jgi:hypothetical protein
LELPCCEAGKAAAPDPCPWHPGFIVLPPAKEDTKRIVDQVFREMGVSPERMERNADDDRDFKPLTPQERTEGFSLGPGESRSFNVNFAPDWDIKPPAYHAPEKPIPFAGDRRVIPWGLIIFFGALAVVCAFTIGWTLSELRLL